MILIVSATNDDHVAAVEPELARRGADVLRLDIADLPEMAQLSVAYQPGRRASPVLRVRDREVNLDTVTAVWSRRKRAPSPHVEIKNEALRDYIRHETTDAWIGASELLDCPWLPAPHWQETRAGYKPLQLQVAADVGFEIPPTLITNNPQDFLDFYRQHNGAVISKTVHNRLLPADRLEGHKAYVLTESVANRDIVHSDAIRYCPVTFQPYVDKQAELRITVVGNRVFPVQIDSQWTNHTRQDWRRSDYHRARYRVHNLPPVVKHRCIKLLKNLGLRFGAIDLIVTPDGRYVFLEINPNGEWLWMEQNTGLPIGAALCDLLLSCKASASSRRFVATASKTPTGFRIKETSAPILSSPAQPTGRTGTRIPQAAVAATLKYLGRLAREGTPPREAGVALRHLAKQHPGTQIELVWDVASSYFGTIQYDVLLRMPGGGSLSLAFSPKGAIPWTLRHARDARETDLLRVNGRNLNMQIIMGYLDGLWYDTHLLTNLVDGCLVREAVDARGIEASENEVRIAMKAFERRAGITSVEARNSWLRGRGWTCEDLKYELRRQLIASKLRRQIGGKPDAYFRRHRKEFDTAIITRLLFDSRRAARKFIRGIKKSTLSLSQALEEAIISGETNSTKGEFVFLRRRDFSPAHSRIVFAASAGQILGPFEGSRGYGIIRVLKIVPAEFDDTTRELILKTLFDEWLAKRRSKASVEWLWGDIERAPRRVGEFTWER